MHNEIEKKAKIDRFLKDERMAEVVRQELLESFMGSDLSEDVQVLAASRIAINLLREAWKNLEKYRSDDSRDKSSPRQVGL